MDGAVSAGRPTWSALPARVRNGFERWTGAPVVGFKVASGGFSPGVVGTVRLIDRRRLFVKAASSAPNPFTPELYRREIEVNRLLPRWCEAPALRGVLDIDGWLLLAFDVVDGSMLDVQDRAQVSAVVEAIISNGEHVISSSNIRTADNVLGGEFDSWARLLRRTDAALDSWSMRHVRRLASIESNWRTHLCGHALVHGDLRPDNVMVYEASVTRIDWAWGHRGAAIFDLLCFLLYAEVDGAASTYGLVEDASNRTRTTSEATDCLLAALAGWYTESSLKPPAPGLPTLRAVQGRTARIARRWVARRLALR